MSIPMRIGVITTRGVAIYIQDQLTLQAKESCPSQSLDAIQRCPSSNWVVVGLRVFSDLESVVGKYGSRIRGGMASTIPVGLIEMTKLALTHLTLSMPCLARDMAPSRPLNQH